MRVESINFLGPIEDIDDIFDCNMDVSVNLENVRNYVVVVGTPKNLLRLIENEKSDFLSPGDPIVIVKKMTKTFNKVCYIELLEKNESLESKNSSLYKEDRIEYRELLSYGVILYNQIIYNRRHDYISLIEKYVTNEIDSILLRLQFFQIQREDKTIKKDLEKNFERLSNVLIDSKSDSEPEKAYGITEQWFHT